MKTKLTRWDGAEYLVSNEEMVSYLKIMMEDPNPPEFVRGALNDVARAMGIRVIAKQTGIDLKELKCCFQTDLVPKLTTVKKVIRGLGRKAESTPRKRAVVKSTDRVNPNTKHVKRMAP